MFNFQLMAGAELGVSVTRSSILPVAAGWLAAVVSTALCMHAFAAGPEPLGQDAFLKRAVFYDGRLWVLSDAGVLSSIAETSAVPIRQAVGDPVLDVCAQDAGLTVVTRPPGKAAAWTLQRRTSSGWTFLAKVPIEHDDFRGWEAALVCDAGHLTLLTPSRLLEIKDGAVRSTRLSAAVDASSDATALGLPDQVLVGSNRGEFGGGLMRIDRATGRVATVERQAWRNFCGPLNAKCDPVNGLAVDPWKPGCVVAAVGVVHFEPSGRLVRVCGSAVERLYARPLKVGDEPVEFPDGQPYPSVAFFGVLARGNILWAEGVDGIYRFDGKGAPTIRPLPAFRKVGGLRVSFALPGVVLVLTEINERHSISGATPIMVGR